MNTTDENNSIEEANYLQTKLAASNASKSTGKSRPSQQIAIDHPSMLLPKKRIKPTVSMHDHLRSRSRESKKHQSPKKPIRTNARLNLLNSKKDIRQGSINARKQRRDLPTMKLPGNYASIFKRNDATSNDNSLENLPMPSSNDISMNSGIYQTGAMLNQYRNNLIMGS